MIHIVLLIVYTSLSRWRCWACRSQGEGSRNIGEEGGVSGIPQLL